MKSVHTAKPGLARSLPATDVTGENTPLFDGNIVRGEIYRRRQSYSPGHCHNRAVLLLLVTTTRRLRALKQKQVRIFNAMAANVN